MLMETAKSKSYLYFEMKIRHVKSLFHIISLEKVTFCFAHCQKSRRIVLRLLRSHLDGSKALRNYCCCECNDLLAKQNPKKSAQEASFGAFYFTFSSLWLFLAVAAAPGCFCFINLVMFARCGGP